MMGILASARTSAGIGVGPGAIMYFLRILTSNLMIEPVGGGRKIGRFCLFLPQKLHLCEMFHKVVVSIVAQGMLSREGLKEELIFASVNKNKEVYRFKNSRINWPASPGRS